MKTFSAGLKIIHGNRHEELREILIAVSRKYPLKPLEEEVILVQSNGIAQWLRFAFAQDDSSGGLGISAAQRYSLPARFLWTVYRDVLGRDAVPEDSPFDNPYLTWRLMRLISPSLLSDDVYEPLRNYLHDDEADDVRKRFQLAQRVAGLYDQYQVYRADWLSDWANGRDVYSNRNKTNIPLPDENLWQARLWRELINDVRSEKSEDALFGSRADVHKRFMEYADSGKLSAENLPSRISVFGLSVLSPQFLEALSALGGCIPVFIYFNNPCKHYWSDIVSERDWLLKSGRQKKRGGFPEKIADDDLHLYGHPLLSSWGKQGRDFVGLLDKYDDASERSDYEKTFGDFGARIDCFSSPIKENGGALLEQLQDDILELRSLEETREKWGGAKEGDNSIQFHIAHSPMREVEILHDRLLDAFDKDENLRPQDVVVMVPDISVYAPYVRAVFGLYDGKGDARFIPFTITDQKARRQNSLLNAFEFLLNLPNSRFAVNDVLDLLDVPALRRRFEISEDDLPLLRQWIAASNVRWGLNGEHLRSLGLPTQTRHGKNTWRFGLRRMLFGYAAGDSKAWREIEAYGEIGGLNGELLGKLVSFTDKLENAWRCLSKDMIPAEWSKTLNRLKDDFFSAASLEESGLLQKFESVLHNFAEVCEKVSYVEKLPLSVVSDYFLSQFDISDLSRRFFGGGVTFANLLPMRSIPFKYVCLLGMNDGDYPRIYTPLDFDLMRNDYRAGDRSRREDDRYLFLEAALSARKCLYISWVGRSIRDGGAFPPSVLVAQLRDHIAKGWFADDENLERFTKRLVFEHPLQPFSAKYFSKKDAKLFTYAKEWERNSRDDEQGAALSEADEGYNLSIMDLADFLRSPARRFFQHRLGVRFEDEEESIEDVEVFILNGLGKWHLRNDALKMKQSEDEKEYGFVEKAARSGSLAHGIWGDDQGKEIETEVSNLVNKYRDAKNEWKEEVRKNVEFNITVENGAKIAFSDVIEVNFNENGEQACFQIIPNELYDNSELRYDRLLYSWVKHVIGNLSSERMKTFVYALGSDTKKEEKCVTINFATLKESQAKKIFSDMLNAYYEGMNKPLPVEPNTAFMWLQNEEKGKNDLSGMRKKYENEEFNGFPLRDHDYLHRVFPTFDDFYSAGFGKNGKNEWIEKLYRPFFDFAPKKKGKKND